MAARKFLKHNAGFITEESAVASSVGAADEGKLVALNADGVLAASIINSKTTSDGAGDSGKIPSLDGSGRLSESFLPTGIGADTASVATSESLAAGDLVNIYDLTGTATVRKADATTSGKPAHGFVLAAFTHPTTAVVYFDGNNSAITGATPGTQFLSTTAGATTTTVPSGSGNVVQVVGLATSATNLNFQFGAPIVLS